MRASRGYTGGIEPGQTSVLSWQVLGLGLREVLSGLVYRGLVVFALYGRGGIVGGGGGGGLGSGS